MAPASASARTSPDAACGPTTDSARRTVPTALRNAGSRRRLAKRFSNTARSRPAEPRLGLGVGDLVVDDERRLRLHLRREHRQRIDEMPRHRVDERLRRARHRSRTRRRRTSTQYSPRFASRAAPSAPAAAARRASRCRPRRTSPPPARRHARPGCRRPSSTSNGGVRTRTPGALAGDLEPAVGHRHERQRAVLARRIR